MKKLLLLTSLLPTIALADVTYYEATVRVKDIIPKTFIAKHEDRVEAANRALQRCNDAGYTECVLIRVQKKVKKDGSWL